MTEQPKKDVKKVVKGKVVRRKKRQSDVMSESLGKAFAYIWDDVALPALKDLFVDTVNAGAASLMYGPDSKRVRTSGRNRAKGDTYVSYSSVSSPKNASSRYRPITHRTRAAHRFDDIILETRQEAEDAIDTLFNLVSQYGAATVSDLYSALGIEAKYTDDDWGWEDVRGAHVQKVREGFMLNLPPTIHLD